MEEEQTRQWPQDTKEVIRIRKSLTQSITIMKSSITPTKIVGTKWWEI